MGKASKPADGTGRHEGSDRDDGVTLAVSAGTSTPLTSLIVLNALDPVSAVAGEAVQVNTASNNYGVTGTSIVSDNANPFGSAAADQADGGLAAAITAPQQAGGHVNADELSFIEEPLFGESHTIPKAIVPAVAKGATYWIAASNPANSYLEGTFTPVSATAIKSSEPDNTAILAASTVTSTVPTGPVVVNAVDPVSSIADQVVQANTATTTYGVTGSGITIGIISDSFNVLGGAAADEADGALPSASNVDILKEGSSQSTDEGRAMAEIVHSIAPGAAIDFYTSGNSDASMAAAVTALQQAGCQIIVDDVSFLDEPFFEEGDTISQAIDSAVAKGVTYFTAASNAADSYYEGTFTPTTTTIGGKSVLAENFGTAANPALWENVTIPVGATVDIILQWAQPYKTGVSLGGYPENIADGTGATSTLDFKMVAGANGVGTAVSYNFGSQLYSNVDGDDPLQIVQYTNTTSNSSFSMEIWQSAGSTVPGLFEIVMNDDSFSPVTFTGPGAGGVGDGDIFGHEEDPNAITVGAVPENDPTTMEVFSSTGPGEFLYDSSGNLLTQPVTANAVDVSAPDGNTTSISSLDPFYGTSAAAPAAAAVGALMLQENSQLNDSDIENILEDTATAINASSAVAGAGLVNADAAVGLASTLTFQLTASTATVLGTHLFDTFIGGPGNHTIVGEGGGDELDYSAAPSGITVNFITGTASNGYGGTDTFTPLTTVLGTAFNDDFILGTTSFQEIWGEGGTDTVNFNGIASGDYDLLTDGGFTSASTSNLGTLGVVTNAALQITATSIINNGELESGPTSSLDIAGAVTGTGTFYDNSGFIELGGATGESFSLYGGTLKLDDATQFAGQITVMTVGTVIDLTDATVASASFGGSILTVDEAGGTIVRLDLPSNLSNDSFTDVSDGAGGTQFTLTTRSLPLAQATVAPSGPIALGNARVGGTLSEALTVTNSAAAPAEALDASIASTTGAATGSGVVSLLAAGQSDSSDIVVGLSTASAGAVSGTVNLALESDGANTDGLIQTPLTGQVVQVSGTVYNEATASFGLPANFIVHVGDIVAQALTVTNTAPSAYSEDLIAGVTSTSGAITASGATGDIAAQSSSSAITVGFSTATAGTVSGSVTVALQTDGTGIDGFGPTALDSQTVNVNAIVDNYAIATLEELSGGGIWTVSSGGGYSLNLGTLALGAAAPVIDLGILNSAIGPADLLSGSFAFATPTGFTNAGFSAFSGIAGGNADSLPTVTLNTTTAGTFSETITLDPTGSNASGYSGALGAEALSITGTIAGSMAWNGSSATNRSGSWNVSSDWKPGLVPTAATKAAINVAGTYTVSNTQASTVGGLTIGNDDATLAINGGPLTIAGAVTNAGTIAVADGNRLQLTKTMTNTGSIDLDATGDATQLSVAGTLGLKGIGELVMSGGMGNAIVSNGAAATLNNYSKIVGTGTVGDSNLTLFNQAGGMIDARTGDNLTLDTATTIRNAGTLEATGGQLTIDNPLNNTGTLSVSSGTLTAEGAVTGRGGATISGGTLDFASTVGATQTLTFAKGVTGGTLEILHPQIFQGTVAGMADGDAIDLPGFVFRRGPTLTVSGSDAAGSNTIVTITDVSAVATIKLYNTMAGEFAVDALAYALNPDQIGKSTAGTLFTLAASGSV